MNGLFAKGVEQVRRVQRSESGAMREGVKLLLRREGPQGFLARERVQGENGGERVVRMEIRCSQAHVYGGL